MANTSIGTAWIQVKPSTKGIASDLKNEFNGAATQIESSPSWANLGLGIATKIGAAFAAFKLGEKFVGIITSAISEVADYEQLSGGIQKIFDEVDYSAILADAKSAYKELNVSINDYLKGINKVGGAFAATMGDKKAYEVAKKGMQAISDYATGFGEDIDLLMDKYKLITRSAQSYQVIADQFSAILPQTSKDFLKQAQAAGYLAKSYKSLTEVPLAEYQEAVTEMIVKGVEAQNLLGNTAAESEKTISGSWLALKASWENLLASLATDEIDTSEAAQTFADSFQIFLEKITPIVIQIFEELWPAINDILDRLGQKIGEWAETTDNETVKTFANTIGAIVGIAQFIGNVVGVITTGIGAVAHEIGKIGTYWDAMVSLIKAGWETIKMIFGQIGNALTFNFEGLKTTAINYNKKMLEINPAQKNYDAYFKYAAGGLIGGIGTSTSDSNIVALSKGEYVLNAAAARSIGYGNLEAMNATGQVFGGGFNITINGYNQDPEELANIISRKIALRERGVLA